MNGSGKERYALDKVVLLGIFTLGLLLAYLLILARSRPALSEPLEFPYTGVSVRIPQGNGWHSEEDWRFVANSFIISSVYSSTDGRITATTEVQYLLAPLKTRLDQQIERYSKELAGTIIATGEIRNSGILIYFAHIRIPDKRLDVFFGIAQLPYGRCLSIEVQAPSKDADWVKQVFIGTAESISLKANHLIERGQKSLDKLKAKGMAQIIPSHGWQRFFLVKDERKQICGFLTGLFTISPDEQSSGITRHAKLYHIKTQQGLFGGHSLFQGDSMLQTFFWISKSSVPGAAGESVVQIELDDEGLMTVEAYMPFVSRTYAIGPAAVPEIFLEPLIGMFLESGTTEAVVDFIFMDGRIVPTRISTLDTGRISNVPRYAYEVRLDFLDREGYYEQIYLDDNKEVLKAVLHRENNYIFQRSNKKEVLKYFPLWLDYFLQMEKQEWFRENTL